jgi:protein TonB
MRNVLIAALLVVAPVSLLAQQQEQLAAGVQPPTPAVYGFTVTCHGGSPAITPGPINLQKPLPPFSSAAQGVHRISDKDAQSSVIKPTPPGCPQVRYGPNARVDVMLETAIDKDGKVIRVSTLRGHVLMNGAAEDSVKQWRFKPFLVDGQPADVVTLITLSFIFTR